MRVYPKLIGLRLISFLFIFVLGCATQGPPISVTINPPLTAIGAGQAVRFAATTNDRVGVLWSTTTGTIDYTGLYTAPSTGQSTTATVTATSRIDPTKSARATIHVVAPGQLSPTANPQVALYSISPGAPGNVSAQFGLTPNYGLTTWTQPVPQGGGAVNLHIAGMKADLTYHIQGVVQFSDGATFMDSDQMFYTTANSLGLSSLATTTGTIAPGMTPQSGVELVDMVVVGTTTTPPAAVTDLEGNVIWSYNQQIGALNPTPIKLLPNGHFLINYVTSSGGADGTGSVMQEVDLSGKLIWQMSAADLNAALAAATCAGCNVAVIGTHHDFVQIPNGHLIVIASTQQTISGTLVTGDVIVDLDPNHKPVWLWNEFDHLDTNRRPMNYPDWTHTNAVIYSPDDGNLIISIRHQNWLVKIKYANGAGNGDILWKLGYQGDFTLIGGTDPTDWFYAQHGPSFVSKNTTGNFTLTLFDNGDDRIFPVGVTCGTSGEPPCLYSTVPILQLDEMAKTATLVFHPTAPEYSFFGGNAEVLNNGDLEYCESTGGPGTSGDIYEITQGSNPQAVWSMSVNGQYAYRGQRIPSLYPGIQW